MTSVKCRSRVPEVGVLGGDVTARGGGRHSHGRRLAMEAAQCRRGEAALPARDCAYVRVVAMLRLF